MEKIIFIFTFVFTLSWTHSIPKEQELQLGNTALTRSRMIILSNVLPVQFWLEGEETFNEKQVCGIEPVCWCMPWNCADPLPFQFLDTFEEDEPSEETIPETLPALSSWLTSSLNVDWYDWTTGATPTVNLPGAGPFEPDLAVSEYLYVDHAFVTGYEYEITLNYDRTVNSGLGNPRTAQLAIMDGAYNVQFSEAEASGIPSGANSIVITFTATESCTRISFKFQSGLDCDIDVTSVTATRTGPAEITPPDPIAYKLQILNTSEEVIETLDYDALLLNSTTYLYSLEFTPEELGYCDNQVLFRIIDADASPDSAVAHSDCLSIKSSHFCTIPIDYSNNKNFNNLIFEDLSPSPTFRIRIPAVFFHEDNPSEQESTELSNGETVRLWNKIEERRHLQIGFLPHYMHRKIQMILMCDTVTIDGKNWIRKEAYEKVEGNRLYPLKKANVWLHDKDFIKENQL